MFKFRFPLILSVHFVKDAEFIKNKKRSWWWWWGSWWGEGVRGKETMFDYESLVKHELHQPSVS